MHVTFRCINGHDYENDLSDELFGKGPLIVPCKRCGEEYVVNKNGEVYLYAHGTGPIVRSFLAMHY